ncbi:MAG TPA: hypothetical protein VG474_07080, partial [Solirubrobacteraceae bacterium]|nr:hypothetical protein [Solirubrobacteraceae bacterium]
MTGVWRRTIGLLVLALTSVTGVVTVLGREQSARRANCAELERRYEARHWPDGCWRPYAASSPFNRRIPRAAPLADGSSKVVERLTDWGPPQNLLAGHADTRTDYFHPLYWSHRRDPVFRVRCILYRPCEVEGHRIRIPERARPAGGGDGHLAVVDARSGWEYDFWQVRSKPSGGGELVVSHGGRTRIGGSGLRSNATAAAFGLAAGVIRAAEIRAGRIDHALFAQIKCTSGRSVYPAIPGGTGDPCERFGLSNAAAPPLGARFRLAMSDRQIARLRVPGWKKTILRALARYGMIVGDTNGGNAAWGLQLESGSTYTSFGKRDPWDGLAEQLGAERDGDRWVLRLDGGVDWARHLRLIAPCV